MINVTKTYLPTLDEYTAYLKKIWDNGWITNNGPLVQELEQKLKGYFGVKHLFFTSNGTIALQIAIKALGLTKEIITTPFSYVATTTSILWENCKPVFTDIDSNTCCINPNLIEEKITSATQAVLATHVYGIPCDVAKIEAIAKKHNLKVIYDAAHAFGTYYKGKSLINYGDISTLSFHATKLFHTVEGGAIITNNDELANKISLYRSFGHVYDDYFSMGINAKNSEFHAAMGLCLLPKIGNIIHRRKEITLLYDNLLKGACVSRPILPKQTEYNYAYYPVLFPNEAKLLQVKRALENKNIFTRRYFYPSLNNLPYRKYSPCPNSESIASRVLCLPLFFELSNKQVKTIVSLIAVQ